MLDVSQTVRKLNAKTFCYWIEINGLLLRLK